MSRVPEFRRALASHTPVLLDGVARAAVAMVLRERGDGPEVLLIERTEKESDPWSGHMAFPGGRVDAGETLEQAARRETLEEVGLSLEGAEALGRLDDLTGRNPSRSSGLVISAFVFHHEGSAPLVHQASEVREALWVPVHALADPARHVHKVFRGTGNLAFPGIVVGDPNRQIVWGLTYRFLEVFHRVAGMPFPSRWEAIERVAR